jgi:hypothetical protein
MPTFGDGERTNSVLELARLKKEEAPSASSFSLR